jgi:hypothetical protein
MNNLEFRVEWENAPGVKDIVLSTTWARLEVCIGGSCVTRVLDCRSRSQRDGVYGSLFPLAEWIVDNWWPLLHEAPRTKRLSARSAGLTGKGWMQRHNLLSARDGGALPDLTITRDGDRIVIAWTEDPSALEDRPVRFITTGRVELAPDEVQSKLSDLVNLVLEKLGSTGDSETERVRTNWKEVARSTKEEPVLCERAARLGLDPYDPKDLPEARVALLEEALDKLPENVRDDFLDATRAEDVEQAFQRVFLGVHELDNYAGPSVDMTVVRKKLNGDVGGAYPYEIGYRLARKFRDQVLGLGADEAIPNIEALVNDRLGWRLSTQQFDLADRHLKGLVGLSKSGAPHLLEKETTSATSRFLQGRALYDLVSGRCDAGPRLLTSAPVRTQAPGRAFAAELLAPSSALRARVQGTLVEEEDLDELAREFQVSEQLIIHQLENHLIATIA